MDVEPVLVEGRIQIPYRWPAGKVAGRFLETREREGRLLALRCPACGKVTCPPRPRCPACRAASDDWIEVGPEGAVVTWTRTRDGVFALVRPDGADTAILERLALDDVKTGMRVRLVR